MWGRRRRRREREMGGTGRIEEFDRLTGCDWLRPRLSGLSRPNKKLTTLFLSTPLPTRPPDYLPLSLLSSISTSS